MKYYDAHGREVTADEAMIGGRCRPGFSAVMEDGEYLRTNILMMRDAKPHSITSRANDMATTRLLSNARYQGCYSMIQAEDSEKPRVATLVQGLTPQDSVAILRKARYL